MDSAGGLATKARLSEPQGLAFDVNGNLLIADWWNNVIRMVSPDGIISTVVGTGDYNFGGDGELSRQS